MKYLLTTIDAFTKYIHIYPIKRATTQITIKKIFEHYNPTYGKVLRINCNNSSQLTSPKWSKKMKEEQIQLSFSSIRHPKSNIIERIHRGLGIFFRILPSQKHTSWAKYVNIIMKIINESIMKRHASYQRNCF